MDQLTEIGLRLLDEPPSTDERHAVLAKAVDQINPKWADVVRRKFGRRISYKEVAAELGVSCHSVIAICQQARKAVFAAANPEWGDRERDDWNGRFAFPDKPTDASPGTEAKIRVFQARYRRGESLFHPWDTDFESANESIHDEVLRRRRTPKNHVQDGCTGDPLED